MMNLKLSIKTAIASVFAICSFSFATVYTVQKGDTIQKIAKKYNVSEEEILKANNIQDPKKLREGQKIKIPITSSKESSTPKKSSNIKEEIYEVKYGDSLEKIAKKYGISVKDLMEYNDMRDEKIFAGDQLKIPLSQESLRKKRQEEARKRVDLSKCEIYTLQRGGTLKHVSKRTGVNIDTLEKLNNIDQSVWLEAGTKVCIGEKKTEELSQKPECELFYKPKEKVSLSDIAKQFNVSKEKIKEINKLSKDYVNKGQVICLSIAEDKSIKNKKYIHYTVKRGDSLEKIASKFNVSQEEIKEINNLSSEKVHSGMKIKIPLSQDKIVKEEKPKEEKVVKEEKPENNIKVSLPKEIKPKNQDETNLASINATKLGWPVRGSVVANFQNDENIRHLGIDISAPCNERVSAAESGKVIYAGDSIKAFGNLVVIRHDNGLTTVYGYLDRITVSEGSRVSKGDEIGRTGRLKNSDNCGIYFEVRKNVTPIDPLKVLD